MNLYTQLAQEAAKDREGRVACGWCRGTGFMAGGYSTPPPLSEGRSRWHLDLQCPLCNGTGRR